jgi:hypothetical protein
MSVKRFIVAGLCLAFLVLPLSIAVMHSTDWTIGTLVDVFEVSYGYNAMEGGGEHGLGNPVTSLWYCNVPTVPLVSDVLPAGRYMLRFIHGRETGNPGCRNQGAYFDLPNLWYMVTHNNPTAIYPETGYDGGTTDPASLDPEAWFFRSTLWLGHSPTDGVKLTNTINEGVGSVVFFDAQAGEKLWLYVHDWFIADNIGGVTAELWQVTAQPVGIDIKPADSTNTIRLSQPIIPVAILGAKGFNPVMQVERASLRFGRTGLEASLVHIGRAPMCHAARVNGDHWPDLVCYFWTKTTAFQAGNLRHPADEYGLLMGRLRGGCSIYAYQSVVINAS